MQLSLLPKPTRSGSVSGVLYLRMGDTASLQGLDAAGGLTAAMLVRGAGRWTSAGRRPPGGSQGRRLDQRRCGTGHGAFPDAPGLPAHLLALLRDVLRAPQFPASELETLRSRAIAGLEGQLTEPGALARNAARHGDLPGRRPAPYRHPRRAYRRPAARARRRPQGLPHPLLRQQPRPARAGRRLRSRRHQGAARHPVRRLERAGTVHRVPRPTSTSPRPPSCCARLARPAPFMWRTCRSS